MNTVDSRFGRIDPTRLPEYEQAEEAVLVKVTSLEAEHARLKERITQLESGRKYDTPHARSLSQSEKDYWMQRAIKAEVDRERLKRAIRTHLAQDSSGGLRGQILRDALKDSAS